MVLRSRPRGLPTKSVEAWKPSPQLVWHCAVVAFAFWHIFSQSALASEIAQAKFGFRLNLHQGWWMDKLIDLKDAQYSFFRSNLPLLLTVAGVHLLGSHAVRLIFPSNRLAHRSFLLTFGLLFNLYVYGSGFIFMISALSISYAIGW